MQYLSFNKNDINQKFGIKKADLQCLYSKCTYNKITYNTKNPPTVLHGQSMDKK